MTMTGIMSLGNDDGDVEIMRRGLGITTSYGVPFRSKLYELKNSYSMTHAICSRSANRSRNARINIKTQKNRMKTLSINLKCIK